MHKLTLLEKIILILNSCALTAWIIWLITAGDNIMFSQDGILAFTPAIPIFFIYVFLFSSRVPDENSDHTKED